MNIKFDKKLNFNFKKYINFANLKRIIFNTVIITMF